jgi:uncharacterized protein YjeT (DUF2065 family)
VAEKVDKSLPVVVKTGFRAKKRIMMKIRPRITLLSVLLILCLPSVSFADPKAISPAPFILAPLFLILEGVVIAFLARPSAPYRIRFIVVWFFVTLFTFLGLTLWATTRKTPITIPEFILAECLVTVLEGGAIYYLLRWRFLARNLSAPPSIYRALIYSIVANIVSLGSSYIWLLIPIFRQSVSHS